MYGCLLELRLRDLGDLVSYGLPQELRLRDQGDLVSYGLPQELRLKDPTRSTRRASGCQPKGCRDLIAGDCLLELRLVQELRL
jgi:hypothetical protein